MLCALTSMSVAADERCYRLPDLCKQIAATLVDMVRSCMGHDELPARQRILGGTYHLWFIPLVVHLIGHPPWCRMVTTCAQSFGCRQPQDGAPLRCRDLSSSCCIGKMRRCGRYTMGLVRLHRRHCRLVPTRPWRSTVRKVPLHALAVCIMVKLSHTSLCRRQVHDSVLCRCRRRCTL